jgi:hypothetical protein
MAFDAQATIEEGTFDTTAEDEGYGGGGTLGTSLRLDLPARPRMCSYSSRETEPGSWPKVLTRYRKVQKRADRCGQLRRFR